MKLVSVVFVGLSLVGSAAFAQGTQTQTPPPVGQAQTPPPASAAKPQMPPAATAPVIVPLPEGTKIAIIDPDTVAQESVAGKAVLAQLKALSDKRSNEIQSKQTQMAALQNKQQTQSAMLTAAAVSQLQKDIDKLNLDIQYMQQTAQKEVNDLQNDLFSELASKMQPILEAYAKEKGLLLVLDARNGPTWAAAGMDISAEIVKRLDAATKK